MALERAHNAHTFVVYVYNSVWGAIVLERTWARHNAYTFVAYVYNSVWGAIVLERTWARAAKRRRELISLAPDRIVMMLPRLLMLI